jgi:rhodanese-related sulfurtransferase
MNFLYKIIAIIYIVITASCAQHYPTDISIAKFKTAIADTAVQLIDVRTLAEFNAGHLPKALLLDWQQETIFLDKLKKLNTTSPTYLYCQSGVRSGQAAAFMQKMGFTKVYTMQGGYAAWE